MGCPLLARQTAQNLVLESWNLKRCILSVAGGVYLKRKRRKEINTDMRKRGQMLFLLLSLLFRVIWPPTHKLMVSNYSIVGPCLNNLLGHSLPNAFIVWECEETAYLAIPIGSNSNKSILTIDHIYFIFYFKPYLIQKILSKKKY